MKHLFIIILLLTFDSPFYIENNLLVFEKVYQHEDVTIGKIKSSAPFQDVSDFEGGFNALVKIDNWNFEDLGFKRSAAPVQLHGGGSFRVNVQVKKDRYKVKVTNISLEANVFTSPEPLSKRSVMNKKGEWRPPVSKYILPSFEKTFDLLFSIKDNSDW